MNKTIPQRVVPAAEFELQARAGRFNFACCISEAGFDQLWVWAQSLTRTEFALVVEVVCCAQAGGLSVPTPTPNPPNPGGGSPPTCMGRVAALVCHPESQAFLRSIVEQLRGMEALPVVVLAADGSVILRGLRTAIEAVLASCSGGPAQTETHLNALCAALVALRNFLRRNVSIDPSTLALIQTVARILSFNPITLALNECCDWT